MTPRDELRAAVLRALLSVAPEADPDDLEDDVTFRDQLDIDSMDFLNFVIRLHEEVAFEIPEADYPIVATLQGCVDYLAAKLEPKGSADKGE